jgi:hypothetical protein
MAFTNAFIGFVRQFHHSPVFHNCCLAMVFGNLTACSIKGFGLFWTMHDGASDKAVLFAARFRHFAFVGLPRTWLGQLPTFDIAEFQDLPPDKLYVNY